MIEVSEEERAYRVKHFHEISGLKSRGVNCPSCGNGLNIKTGNVLAHPVIGVLQCEPCYRSSKQRGVRQKGTCCCICGTLTKLCFCKTPACQFTFCLKCIKRNSTLSLLDVDQNNHWTCFVCESKPLWKLRGISAVILDAQSGKNKRSNKCEKVGSPEQRHTCCKSDTMQKSKSEHATISQKRHKLIVPSRNISSSSDESADNKSGTQSLQNKSKKKFEYSNSRRSKSDNEQQSSTSLPNITQRKSKIIAACNQNVTDEDSKSSSGREFQKTKLTASGHSTLKKISARNTNAAPQSKITRNKRSTITKEQSFDFISNATQVLNKFKNMCWALELKLDGIKCLHLRKEVKSIENANNITHEVTELVKKLKVDLDGQCKELEEFQQNWAENCLLSDEMVDIGDSISNDEIADDDKAHGNDESEKNDEQKRKSIPNKTGEKASKKKSSKVAKNDQSVNDKDDVSDMDSDVIFSEPEEKSRPYVPRRAASHSPKATKMDLNEVDETASEDDEYNSCTSKDSKKETSKKGSVSGVSDETNETAIILQDEIIASNSVVSSPTKIASDDDLFNDSAESEKTLILCPVSKPAENSNDVEDVSEAEESCLNLRDESPSHSSTLEAVKSSDVKIQQTTISSSDTKSDEKLDLSELSDIEITSELSPKTTSKSAADAKSLKTAKKIKKSDKSISSSHNESMSDENSDNIEEATKQALLELSSDSDDSIKLCSTKSKESTKHPKVDDDGTIVPSVNKKACVSDSKTASSNEDDNCKEIIKKNDRKGEESKKDVEQNSDECSSDISVVTGVKRRRVGCESKLDKKYRTDKKLQMKCVVELERMSRKDLRKYEKALKKSKEYLEHKKIDSLVNVDKLDKRSKKSGNTSVRSKGKPVSTKSATNQESPLEESDEAMDIEEKLLEDSDDSDSFENLKSKAVATVENISDQDKLAKQLLLDTSDSDLDVQKDNTESSDAEKPTPPKKKPNSDKNVKKDNSDKEDEKDKSKSKWRQDKILTMKFSDSEEEMEKECAKMTEKCTTKASDDEDNQTTQDEVIIIKQRKRRRGRKRILLSDSDAKESKSSSDSESSNSSDSDKKIQKKKKRRINNSSGADTSEGEKKKKRIRRRRIKQMDSDSDSDKSDGSGTGKGASDPLNSSQGSLGKKGRKNIRKVLKDTRVADDTKQAAKEEEERMGRIAERERLYNELYEQRLAAEEKLEELVLDFDNETKQPRVSVHKEIVKHLKPHQADGIRFMWNSCFESVERIKTSQGSGCIVAHCMGLGKTLQVISLVHTILMHDDIGIRTVMIVSPLSTVLNWVNEVSKWLKDTGDSDDIEVYELTKLKNNVQRKYQLESWQRTGGMLIIGYDMFRNLTGTNKNMRKNIKETMLKCLVDPGADLVVCDEGHLLKNEDTALSKCMTRIKTRRRIVLTGTPLQNNLTEYHCMVQFVKPSLLGTKHEFLNRFVNPINNGQYDDSTPADVKLMKKRAYILNKMLKGSVQRFDYSVLTPFLPPKQEYVIFISLTEVQIKLYQHYLDNFARQYRGPGGCLFADFQALLRIWSHPLALRYNEEKMEKLNEKKQSESDSEGSLKDFINDESDSAPSTSSSSGVGDEVEIVKEYKTRGNNENNEEIPVKDEKDEPQAEEEPNDSNKPWWEQYVSPEHFEDLHVSGKLMLFFGILKECQQIGDKLLVFSQSLYVLRIIEQFLRRINASSGDRETTNYLNGHTGDWTLGADYFRLDGQTSAENRNIWCRIFNSPTNTRARLFLISTKAGGLGINLTAANRVIIFDANWNPSLDMQSIFRIYRFGQKKPCYVYRFLAAGTMEEKIYNRQVTKLSLSCRVVDEQQIERHYTNSALSELYKLEPNLTGEKRTLNLPKDRLLADIFLEYKDYVENYHEHDSLLENKTEEELDEEERKQAWLEYEEEKKEKPRVLLPMPQAMTNNVYVNQYGLLQNLVNNAELQNLQELIRKDFPNISAEQQKQMAMRKLLDMYSYVEQQAVHGRHMGNFQLPNMQQINGPMYVRQQQQQQQQLQQRPQQQEIRNEREVLNPYAYANVGSSAPRQIADNDVIEIVSGDTNVQVQDPLQSVNRNQEE